MKFTNVKVLLVLLLSLLSLSSPVYMLEKYRLDQFIKERNNIKQLEKDGVSNDIATKTIGKRIVQFINSITFIETDHPQIMTVQDALMKLRKYGSATQTAYDRDLIRLGMNYRSDVVPAIFTQLAGEDRPFGMPVNFFYNSLALLKYFVENGFDMVILRLGGKSGWSVKQYNYEKLIKNYMDLGQIAFDKDLQVGPDHWLAIVASRGDLAGLNKIWAMTSQQEIDAIPLERKQEILELAIRKGNLEVVTELIGRFGVAANKQLAQAIIDDFPLEKEPFIRKAFAQVDWGEKAPVAAEKLEDLKKYVGMKLK